MADNTYKTYSQVGIKEDISDVITMITPTKTPFQSMIGNEKVNNTYFQWQEDSLRAVATNAKVEGATAIETARTPTVLRANYTQIIGDTIKVSGTSDVVSLYGRAKESAYQLSKVAAELKRDYENALVGNGQTKAAGSSTVARTFDGYQAMIDATLQSTVAASGTTPTEATVLTCLQNCYNAGSEPSVLMVTPTDSLTIAGYASATGRYRFADNGGKGNDTVVNNVSVYVTPFGDVKVVLNRFLQSTNSLIFDPSMWNKVTLRPWTREALAKVGDSNAQMLVGEFSLKHKNFKASALLIHA